jgi:glycosyltransferase involved in cell wall biosynthesis
MRVTVVMPVYNAMPYLPVAVKSILDQSFKELCCVAVDDRSTDNSYNYLSEVNDPRLRILRMGKRGGQGAARNLVIKDCKTEYVAFADADDISLPTRIELQVAHLDEHPDIGMLGTGLAYVGATGKPGFPPPLPSGHPAIRKDLMLGRHAVSNNTLMFRTSVFERTGLFRIGGAGEDWDLFLRMTEETRVANLPQILCYNRMHRGSTNLRQARTVRLRYAHARECAGRRKASLPESDFEDFCERESQRPFWTRCADHLDQVSACQYRMALETILGGGAIGGYGRLLLASLLSPHRVAQRISRTLRQLLARSSRELPG